MSVSLFLGERGGNRLLKADTGYQDAGGPIAILAETVPVSPTGPGGEAIFSAIYVVTTSTMAATLRITPIIDGAALEPLEVSLPASPKRTTRQVKVRPSLSYSFQSVERFRTAPRGSWLQVRIEANPIADGDLIIEGVSLEYEPVRESIGANTP